MNYKNTILWTLPVLMLCSCGGNKYGAMEGMARIPQVSVAVPQVMGVTLANEYPGYLTADNSLALVARVNGYLNQVTYKPGQYVKKGEVLFVIEPTLYENAVSQAQSQLDAAKAQLVYAENHYQRSKEAAVSDAISEIDVIQAKSAMDQAKANIINATAALSTAKTNLGYCYVKAPESGKMSVNLYAEGAYINGAGAPVTLATVYDDQMVFANFTIPETMLPEIGNLDSLTISYGGTTATYSGKIDYISPNVAVETGTIKVRAKLYNRDNMLRDGLYVTVVLPYARDKQAVLVDNNSIGVNQAGKYLYVLSSKDSAGIYTVTSRYIEEGPLVHDTLRVVVSGISPGEKYVNKAMMKVRSGSKVRVAE